MTDSPEVKLTTVSAYCLFFFSCCGASPEGPGTARSSYSSSPSSWSYSLSSAGSSALRPSVPPRIRIPLVEHTFLGGSAPCWVCRGLGRRNSRDLLSSGRGQAYSTGAPAILHGGDILGV